MKPKKIPLRMCLGCAEMKPKAELIRVVKEPDGTVCLDSTGKKNGRGAYLCPSESCLRRVQRSKRAEKVLECAVPDEVYEAVASALAEDKA
jgi:predicted RNA-binding protein YlxR (DUF448 family)